MLVRSAQDIANHLDTIHKAAADSHRWLTSQTNPLVAFYRTKFEPVGSHPIQGQPLNLIEQINQTWTYIVALEAARLLLQLHPDAGGYRLAPGAHMAMPLDIMSEVEGLVGAEVFAAVTPANNNKLAKDLEKLSTRPETHRYVFFMSPQFRSVRRQPQLEKGGVQVWSIEPDEFAFAAPSLPDLSMR